MSSKIKYDCFLAPCWGEVNSQHKAIAKVYEALTKKKIKCYYNKRKLSHDMVDSRIHAMDASRKGLVFISKAFFDAMEDLNSLILKEFRYMFKKGMIFVLLDSKYQTFEHWPHYPFFMLEKKLTIIDMSSNELIARNMDYLVKQIRRKKAKVALIQGAPQARIPTFDAFLSHTWGKDRKLHDKVVQIENMLESVNIGGRATKCWLDTTEMYPSVEINFSIAQGLSVSNKYIIFLSELLIERAKDHSNYMAKEISYISRYRDRKDIILVSLTKECLNRKNWKPYFKRLLPGHYPMLDMSTDKAMKDNIKELKTLIHI